MFMEKMSRFLDVHTYCIHYLWHIRVRICQYIDDTIYVYINRYIHVHMCVLFFDSHASPQYVYHVHLRFPWFSITSAFLELEGHVLNS